MAGQATIATDVLATYAADAALEVPGVTRLVGSPVPGRHAVRVASDEQGVRVELRVEVAWGTAIVEVGGAVQQRVAEYLLRMADVHPLAVDVVVDEIGARP